MTTADLPCPPLTETALSLGFSEFHRLMSDKLDDLWNAKYRRRFPKREEMGPYSPMIEEEEGGLAAVPSAAPLTNVRRWFLSRGGNRLVQVQRNWFAYNWRIAGHGVTNTDPPPYPGYRAVRDGFTGHLETFIRFAEEEDLGEFQPRQCEISYVSHLPAGGAWKGPGEADKALRLFAPLPAAARLPEQEAMRHITQFVITGPDGKRLGRLYARVETALAGEAQLLVLTLFARSPAVESLEQAARFFDLGHEWIVKAFYDLVSPEALAEFEDGAG